MRRQQRVNRQLAEIAELLHDPPKPAEPKQTTSERRGDRPRQELPPPSPDVARRLRRLAATMSSEDAAAFLAGIEEGEE